MCINIKAHKHMFNKGFSLFPFLFFCTYFVSLFSFYRFFLNSKGVWGVALQPPSLALWIHQCITIKSDDRSKKKNVQTHKKCFPCRSSCVILATPLPTILHAICKLHKWFIQLRYSINVYISC